MYAVEKLSSYITRGVYTVSGPFHPFGGAVDIIVVQQQDGSFKSSPWYVRFGKFQGVLKAREKVVAINVNGAEAGFHMYLDNKGEAYFLKECESEVGEFEMSPPSSGDEMNESVEVARFKKVQSCNYDERKSEPIASLENGNGTILMRSPSRRSRIFGLMFGSRSMKGKVEGVHVERAASLERAEIAADLLETQWSTNLPPSGRSSDNSIKKNDFDSIEKRDFEVVSSSEEGTNDNFGTTVVSEEHFEEVEIHNPSIVAPIYIGDDPNCCLSSDDSLKELLGPHEEKLVDDLLSNMVREVHFGETITQTSISSTQEEVLEAYTSETGDLSNTSTLVSEPTLMESDERNISSNACINVARNSGSSTDEMTLMSPEGKYDVEKETNDAQSLGSEEDEKIATSSEEKYGGEQEVSSLSCTETLKSSTVAFDDSMETHSILNLFSEAGGPPQEHACNVTFRPESENSQDFKSFTAVSSSSFQDSRAGSPTNAAFRDTLGNNSNMDYQKSCFSESHIIPQEREVIELHQRKVSRAVAVDFLENRYLVIEDGSAPNGHVMEHSDISMISNQGQEFKRPGDGGSEDKPSLPNKLKVAQDGSKFQTVESLEEEQFQFSDIDSFSVKQINPEVQVNNAVAEVDVSMLLSIEGDMEEHMAPDTNQEECLESVPGVSGSQTSPIAIPKSMSQLGKTGQLAKSLPIVRSQIHDIDRSNLLHPLSCSLDLNSNSYKECLLEKEHSGSAKLESGPVVDMIQGNHTPQAAAKAVDSEDKEGHNVTPVNSAVEMSLCKHLLFEGMGVDAATRVFDTNKVNLEKFSNLGSSLVKNDKLVIRIGGRYFPWDAAAPIILGMVCFGQEQMLEPQGMISVDQDEKNDHPSSDIVPSAGSWRLWPFSSKKSRSISTVRSLPESATQESVDVDPPRSQSLMGHDDIQRSKLTKKKVRSLAPTSEELASLNLKEGRNVVSFSFSTAMLGQQQVDARIYLWKWNTRIVISDVDGTITKSDVLGQFMPLVGKDWSQTGVTHLFSAIKENGYQLLFLSARAISQAYLTRQFLFNLKQDGKALPDGPVVISPDGLFPSLYREVIRRAPHEFKISCLEDIRALFPAECNPFYAGFGNRDTDELSYLKVGVPKGKIFIINTKGEVAVNRRVNTKSYTSLHALVNGMFPPVSTSEQEDFNSWNYWKLPLPDVVDI